MFAGSEILEIGFPKPKVMLARLKRPGVLNAVNTALGRDILRLFDEASGGGDDIRCIVLTGSGDRAFCVGGDLKERATMDDGAWQAQHIVFEKMMRALLECPVPVIAAVNGHAYGGGCEIAAACDVIYASQDARFALTEVTLGIIPGCGGTQTLSRAVGQKRANELIMTGLPFSAQEALSWGLVNRVLPAGELLDAALETAARIAGNAPLAVQRAKQAIRRGIEMSLPDGMGFEIEAYNRLVHTKDRYEGVRAFNERRRPDFEGE